MKINVLEEKKNKIVFEVDGVGHTFINALKNEMWNDEHIKIATYSIRHPIISKPKMIIETDGNESPKAAITNAINRLKKDTERSEEHTSELQSQFHLVCRLLPAK